jgi:hypothetical protein
VTLFINFSPKDEEYETTKDSLESLYKQAEERKERLRTAQQELVKFEELLKKLRAQEELNTEKVC